MKESPILAFNQLVAPCCAGSSAPAAVNALARRRHDSHTPHGISPDL